MKLLLVTSNPHKKREFERLLQGKITLYTLSDFALDQLQIDETGESFEENAAIKIATVRPHVPADLGIIADDSGLEVDALSGAPGIYSARFAGAGATDAANNHKLIEKLHSVPSTDREAHYVCALAYQKTADAPIDILTERCSGVIIDTPRGTGGFGYDPYFYLPKLGKTMAELSPDEKDATSHRGKACRALLDAIMGERCHGGQC